MTFMRESIIPPPMCGWEIEFPSSIHSVDFVSSDSRQLCVVTHCGHMHFFCISDCEEEDRSHHPEIKIVRKDGGLFRPVWSYSASLDFPNYCELYHWRLVNHSTMVACSVNRLLVLELSDSSITIKYFVYSQFRLAHIKMFQY